MSTRKRNGEERREKGANGSSDSIVIHLDPSDPSDARALEMAKLLASKHGRRRGVLVAVLEAMHTYYQRTGVVMTPIDVATAILGQGSAATAPPPHSPPPYTPPPRPMPPLPAEPTPPARPNKQRAKKQAEECANNYLKSMAGLFD